jgi:uncharacterized protein YndB with AHSA1/START domain
MALVHETLVLHRSYAASPARVFRAWADPAARLRWGPPSDGVAMVYDAADFRVGGQDVSRCGTPGLLEYRVEVRYLDILPDQRIVMSETVAQDGQILSAALITVELAADGTGTRLAFTDQVAAIGGPEMIAGSRAGWNAALDNLVREISGAS